MNFETKIRSFIRRLIASGGETQRKWSLGMSNEDCLPLFYMEGEEDKLKAQAFFFVSMASRGRGSGVTELLGALRRFSFWGPRHLPQYRHIFQDFNLNCLYRFIGGPLEVGGP